MERLIDRDVPPGSDEGRLRDLIEASCAVGSAGASKWETFACVLARRHRRRQRGLSVLRPAAAVAVLVAAGATAASTVGSRWLTFGRSAAPASQAPAPVQPRHHRSPAPPAPSASPEPAHVSPAMAPATRRPQTSRARARGEDPSQVVAAVEALRKQRDPDRAAKLLAEYLTAHPRGALVEEAVALSIEAAAARHDPAASAFARRYLEQFPRGRFRQTAEAVLARAARAR